MTTAAVLASVLGALTLAGSRTQRPLLFAVPILAFIRITLNALDGMVAQATDTAHPGGELFNEFADRLSDTAWMVGLAYVIEPLLAIGALVVVLLASFVGVAVRAAGGPREYSGVMGKADRMAVVSIGATIAFFVGEVALTVAAWVIGVGAFVTVLQRIKAARRHLW